MGDREVMVLAYVQGLNDEVKGQWEEDLRKVFSLSSEEEAALNSFFLTLTGYEKRPAE